MTLRCEHCHTPLCFSRRTFLVQTMVLGASLTTASALLDACASTNCPQYNGNGQPMKGIKNVSLVREESSPAVYLIVGDTKFWIVDPNEFNTLGFEWNKIRVVADGTLNRFTQKLLHAPNPTRPTDVYFDCSNSGTTDGCLGAPFGNIYTICQDSASLVRKDVLVAGWLTLAPTAGDLEVPHVNLPYSPETGVEDVHYNLILDAVFLDRIYGPNGLSTALRGAYWPGNPPVGSLEAVPFDYVSDAPGKPRHQDLNSWILLGADNGNSLHVELNAWHTSCTGGFIGHAHFKGRGPQPDGWVNPLYQDRGAWFPFDPLNPEGTLPLELHDYVVIRGALWQDSGHGNNPPPYTGWAEIHPPDWIVRVSPPGPNARLTTFALGTQTSTNFPIPPDFQSRGLLRVRSITEKGLIDTRFTYPLDSVTYTVGATKVETPSGDHVEVQVDVKPNELLGNYFKASWLVGWTEIDPQDVAWWVSDQLPPGAMKYGDCEMWDDWSNDSAFYGQKAHRSALVAGMHRHYFLGATKPLMVTSSTDTLFAMICLDPDFPPNEVMLEWHTTDWLSRAYWGDNLLNWGTDGTADRFHMGPLPSAGEWVRLNTVQIRRKDRKRDTEADTMAYEKPSTL